MFNTFSYYLQYYKLIGVTNQTQVKWNLNFTASYEKSKEATKS